MKHGIAIAMLAVMASCTPTTTPTPPTPPAPTGPIPDTGVSLSRGACFGTCPIYTITVSANEFYTLDLGMFTRAPGTTETGVFPAGTFAAATNALRNANFSALPTDITSGSPDCGGIAPTDLPSAQIGEITIAGPRIVDYYIGCFDAPSSPAVLTLLGELDGIFGLPALVN